MVETSIAWCSINLIGIQKDAIEKSLGEESWNAIVDEPRKSVTEIKSIQEISEGILNKDDCNINEELEVPPSASKVYKFSFLSAQKQNQDSTSSLNQEFARSEESTNSDDSKYLFRTRTINSLPTSMKQSRNLSSFLNLSVRTVDDFKSHVLASNSKNPENLEIDVNKQQLTSHTFYQKSPNKRFMTSKTLGVKPDKSPRAKYEYYTKRRTQKLQKEKAQMKTLENQYITNVIAEYKGQSQKLKPLQKCQS